MYHICSREQSENFCLRSNLPFRARIGHYAAMLKKTDRQTGEAKIRYLDADLELLSPGDYVICAVTGRKIPIAALRYWSVDHQEAYVDATAAATRMGGQA